MENFIFCAVLFPADYCRSVSTSQISQISATLREGFTSQKIKFSIQDFFSKCDKIRNPLWIWSNLLNKSLMEKFTVCSLILI